MGNTLAEIRGAVLRNLDRVGAPVTETADVNRWINQAIREDICSDHNWSFMEAEVLVGVTLGVSAYALSGGTQAKDIEIIRYRALTTNDYVTLDEISYQGLLEDFTEQTKGTPRVWARRGSNYVLRPIPDATLVPGIGVQGGVQVLYWKYPDELVVDGGSNDLTNFYPALLEAAVTVRGLLHYGEDQRAGVWQTLYEQQRARSIKIDRARMAPADMHLNISPDAGRKARGFSGSNRSWSRSAYFWW